MLASATPIGQRGLARRVAILDDGAKLGHFELASRWVSSSSWPPNGGGWTTGLVVSSSSEQTWGLERGHWLALGEVSSLVEGGGWSCCWAVFLACSINASK